MPERREARPGLSEGRGILLLTMDSFTWQITPFDWTLAERISTELDVPLVVGVVLARRGFGSVHAAREFLDVDPHVPDPFLLHDMESAVDMLSDAIDRAANVVVHGDYDVDGISATALMVRGLADLGLTVRPFLPSRFVEGYGLSSTAVRTIAAEGTDLLVTVDCGVNYPEEVDLALSLGLQVLVTDHHQPGDILPSCPVVHTALAPYPGSQLCGVGVALKLLHALHVRRLGASPWEVPERLQAHLDLVALGTIADIVPLLGENRYYVKEGLRRISWERRPGLRALLKVSNSEGKVDASTVAYRLAPRLNAAGRMGEARASLQLLLTDDEEKAGALAAQLDAFNRQRQEVEQRIVAEALAQAEALQDIPPVLVLSGQGWHEGVVGIVASRLAERFHRPTVLLAVNDDQARGSGRSIPAYDLMAGLKTCEHLLTVYGGHHQAAGLTLPVANIPALAERLAEHASGLLSESDLLPKYSPDAIVSGCDLSLETAEALSRLAPFGAENPPVRLLALGAKLKNLELTRTGDHLLCQVVVDGIRTRGIGFGLGAKIPVLREHEEGVHAGLRLEVNEWRGTARTELHLHSLYRMPDRGEAGLGCTPDCPWLDALDAGSPCGRCADPFADVSVPVFLPGRDLRGQPGRPAFMAQVLSSGEPTAIVSVSVPHRMSAVAAQLPLMELGVRRVDCVSRLCWRTRSADLPDDSLLFIDWTAAERRWPLLARRRHLLVMDPPYRGAHVALLQQAVAQGLSVHLCYAEADKQFSAEHLRFLLQPRFWMVNLYRAYQAGHEGPDAFEETARRAWATYGVLPTAENLKVARDVLVALGHDRGNGSGPARPEGSVVRAEDVEAYAVAEAAYQEARRMCLSM